MSDDGTFTPLGDSDRVLPGPRALVVCGLTAAERDTLSVVQDPRALRDAALIAAGEADAETPLLEVAGLPDGHGAGRDSGLARAVIMSGLREKEVHAVMAFYKGLGLPRPLWATMTPTSAAWPLRALLDHLGEEAAAVARTLREQQ